VAGDYRYESKSGMAPPASPAIRKIARDLDIDLTRVRGSESGGRINLADLRTYVQKPTASFPSRPSCDGSVAAPTPPVPAPAGDRFCQVGPIRRETPLRAQCWRMVESGHRFQINQFADADISALRLRKNMRPATRKKRALTLTSFVLFPRARALEAPARQREPGRWIPGPSTKITVTSVWRSTPWAD
jgi:pyruvate dehydrogenase E2 component (dihydrolipoamide acetyltransferase)